jgi:hypothetical protein
VPISVVVVVAALLVALYITQPNSPLWVWKAPAKVEAPAAAEMVSTETKHVKWWKRNPFSLLRHLRSQKSDKAKNGDMEMNNTEVTARG